jgi:putative flippase GtrA
VVSRATDGHPGGRYPAQVLPFSDRLRVLRASHGRLAGRYVIVSLWNTLCHQVTLLVAYSGFGWSGGWSNVFAACVAAVPAYFLSRAWVWRRSGRHSFQREVLPFWLLALAGLLASTIMADIADRAFGQQIWINIGSLSGYFLVWVVKFFLLDTVLFPRTGGRGAVVR